MIERLNALYSNEGETIFSPFAGIASEGYQSILMNRNFTGFELKESYYKQGLKNLHAAQESMKQKEIFETEKNVEFFKSEVEFT